MMYVNGLVLMEDEEYVLLRVGVRRACTVAVFDRELRERDVVQAEYLAESTEER